MPVHAPSAIGINQPYVVTLPVPFTGTAGDLRDAAYSYAGIAAAAMGRISKVLTLWPIPRTLTLHRAPAVLTALPEPELSAG